MITALLCLLLAGILLYLIAFKKYSPALFVLTYHKIGVPPKNSRLKNSWTSLKRLEKDFRFLVRHHFNTISPQELGKTNIKKPVLLAFIGGYQTFFTEVFPLLKQYNLKACVLLTPDTIGAYNRWQNPYKEPWQNILTAQQIKELSKSTLISFGTLGLTENGGPSFEITLTQSTLEESASRFERLHKVSVRAVYMMNKKAPIPSTALPVLLPKTGKNDIGESKLLRTFPPSFFTRLLLWQHR